MKKIEELLETFNSLDEKEKLIFFEKAVLAMAGIFKKNPRQMFNAMMPMCREMMSSGGFNLGEMMNMMFNKNIKTEV